MRFKKSVCLTFEVTVIGWIFTLSFSQWKLEKVMTACSLSLSLLNGYLPFQVVIFCFVFTLQYCAPSI